MADKTDAPVVDATLDNGTDCPVSGYCQNCGKTVTPDVTK